MSVVTINRIFFPFCLFLYGNDFRHRGQLNNLVVRNGMITSLPVLLLVVSEVMNNDPGKLK